MLRPSSLALDQWVCESKISGGPQKGGWGSDLGSLGATTKVVGNKDDLPHTEVWNHIGEKNFTCTFWILLNQDDSLFDKYFSLKYYLDHKSK